jgi:amino acid adenylation domain-containing protein
MDDQKKRKEVERYWLKRLAGDLPKLSLPRLIHETGGTEAAEKKASHAGPLEFPLPETTFLKLKTISKGSNIGLFVLFLSGLNIVLNKYTGQEDLVIGTISLRTDTKGVKDTLLFCRNRVSGHLTLQEMINQVKENVKGDLNHAHYSFGVLYQKLALQNPSDVLDIFNVAFIYDEFQNKSKLLNQFDILLVLTLREDQLVLQVEYNSDIYSEAILRRFCHNVINFFDHFTEKLKQPISTIDIICAEERRELFSFNDTKTPYPMDKTIHRLFEEQVKKIPESIAVISDGVRNREPMAITYRQLDRNSNQLASLLRTKGVKEGAIIGLMVERSLEMVVSMLAILKAGGAWLPIDIQTPPHRLMTVLKDSGASFLLTQNKVLETHSFTFLQGLQYPQLTPHVTPPCEQERITDFDSLPFPDRSLIDYEKYNQYIGQALVKNRIIIQASRGCPHHCAYCYRIWPRKQVPRSGENIFAEMLIYYNMGIKKFDIFMLNIKKGRRLFELIIENNIEDIQLFFPNGFRGDLLTEEYIDLMVKAGTINFALALETASPRLQKKINKHLNLEKFRKNVEYISQKYPHVILELFTMHGIPTETEEEAMMTLDFIKSLKWIHFPYVNVLKIYHNTDMEQLALEAGIPGEAILRSENLAWHEWSETLPFDKSFTSRYQTDFLNNYLLSKERLLHVLPHQMKVLSEDEFVQKYDSYLPVEIKTFEDFLEFAGLRKEELAAHIHRFRDDQENASMLSGLNEKIRQHFHPHQHQPSADALRVLLLDLSQFFHDDSEMLYDVVDPPLGLMYILTWLNHRLGEKINGKILKSRMDFEDYSQLKAHFDDFKPHVLGIRTLTYYKDLFHQTVAAIRQWGIDVPIITGGPYATVDYETLLQDRNIDLAVLGEGETIFCRLIEKIIENGGKLPDEEVLRKMPGIAFVPRVEVFPQGSVTREGKFAREILMLDMLDNLTADFPAHTPVPLIHTSSPAYIIYTSGSTGNPKGVVTQHRQVVNVLTWFGRAYQLKPGDHVMQLTNYTFDPSVEQIFSTLLHGATLYIADREFMGSGKAFNQFVEKYHIDIVNFVPDALKELLNREKRLKSLRAVISGGEKLDETVKNRIMERGYPLYNQYGPTETTIDALMKECSTGPVTLGRPISNVQCYIMDEQRNLAPVGVTGELYIGGAGVAPGYLNQPELTVEKFDQDFLDYLDYQDEKSPAARGPYIKKEKGIDKNPSTSLPLYPSTSLYRTGDLVRWLPNGEVEFFGRNDHQMKIRGLRIEPGEIETQLLQYPGIAEAVVTNRKSESGDNYLCAYIVPTNTTDDDTLKSSELESELKDYLSSRLPDYMVPPHVLILEKLPRTINGKIDRKVLPDPWEIGLDNKVDYAPPTDETEEKLVEVWESVLSKNNIGIHENFFMIGGDSIKSIQIISRMNKAGYKVEMNDLFKYPTVAQLAPRVKKAEPLAQQSDAPADGDLLCFQLSKNILDDLTARVEGEIKDIYPLTPMQEGMLIHSLYDRGSSAYFEQMSYRLHGQLNVDVVEKCLNELLKRHDILRTVFIHEGLDRPLQVVLKERQVDFYFIELHQLKENSKTAVETFVREFKEKDRQRLFDLSKDVLMRVTLIQVDKTAYEFIWSHHHILMDGWCAAVLIFEFFEIYNSVIKNRPYRLRETKSYKTYIKWLEERDKEESKAYWANYLDNYGEITSVPRIKVPKPHEKNYKNDRVLIKPGREKTKNLIRLAGRNQVTLNIVIQTLWGILLSRYTGKEDVVFGSVVSGRPPDLEDVETMIGLFINTVPVRIQFNGETRFNHLLQQVQRRALESEPHHYCPLADIQSHSQLKQNLLDHIIVFENTPYGQPLENLLMGSERNKKEKNRIAFELSNYEAFEQTNYDFNLLVYPGEEMTIRFEFNANIYEKESVHRIAGHMENALEQVLERDTIPISQIFILSAEEERQLLVDFNNTQNSYPKGKTLHQLFEESVERAGDNIAVICSSRLVGTRFIASSFCSISIAYNELNKKSNQLSWVLREKGIQPDNIVGLMANRSIEMIIGILGILKAGGAYLPIDPDYPQDRIDYMLKDSDARILVSGVSKVSGRELPCLFPEVIDLDKISGDSENLPTQPINHSTTQPGSSNLVHVIYTSGSTGRPKGVILEHQSVVNFVYDLYENYYKRYQTINPGRLYARPLNIALIASYVFAGSVKQIFPSILFGHCLYIVPEEGRFNGDVLIDFLDKHNIDIIDATPAHIKILSKAYDSREDKRCGVKHFNISADVLPKELMEEFLGIIEGDKPDLANFYGPTECCVDSTGYMINPREVKQWNTIPIGSPLANTTIYILTLYKTVAPIGVVGDLYIAGDGVARGYLNNPELTAEKFDQDFLDYQDYQDEKGPAARGFPKVPDNIREGTGGLAPLLVRGRIYRTGDLARWLPGGNLEFFGRKDKQVNIRGYRIEPGEIENTINQYPGIEESVVVTDEVGGELQLTAYVTTRKKILLRPSWAEQFVYDDMAYYAMASDEYRNEKYRTVFNSRLKDKIVLEIGPGSDITLTQFCIEAGARKIYAVEIFEDAYKKARQKIESSGLGDNISLIHGDVATLTLPEKVDYCVSEIVGSIGGSQGSARIINQARKLLKNPEYMIPARSISKIAAITLPRNQFDYAFDSAGAHYTNKIFEKAGYKFDLRLCLANFKKQYIISTSDVFEDLDYTKENPLEAEHSIHLEIEKDSIFNGFIVWLQLYIDAETVIDTLKEGKLWLPLYLPVFSQGIDVKKGDQVKAQVVRKLSFNNVNPDYIVTGVLFRRKGISETFYYNWFNQQPLYKQNKFYKKVFAHDKPRIEEEITAAGLREFLSKTLPPYMVPPNIVFLDQVPLTTSGKIDYKALLDLKGDKAGEKTYIPPFNESEEKILRIWADVLEIDISNISVEDDFFELGGNSITILNVLSRIKKEFNHEVPFSSLFLHPTIRSLAANIKEQGILSQLECIVRLNKGKNKKNIFIIHPMHGMVYQYKDLAVLLENHYNVYGVQARGLVRKSPLPETMEIMTADYITQLRTVQNQGPYIIAAHCFGDILAYNMVKEMENMGLNVERLIMLDEPAFILAHTYYYFKRRDLVKSIFKPVIYLVKKIKQTLGFNTKTPCEKIMEEMKRRDSKKKEESQIAPEEVDERKARVHMHIERMDRKYWQTSSYQRLVGIIKTPLLIVKAKERDTLRFSIQELKYMTYSKDIKVVESPGTHDTLFEKENVESLAEVIKNHAG